MPAIHADDRCNLERAWGLAILPMANTHYVQAALQFLDDGKGGVCWRAMLMFELAVEIFKMRGDFDDLLAAWRRRPRADTAPQTPAALRGAA